MPQYTQGHVLVLIRAEPVSGVCGVLLGLLHPQLSAPQPHHVAQRAHLPDHQGNAAAQPPRLHGAGGPQEDRCQHLQQAGGCSEVHTPESTHCGSGFSLIIYTIWSYIYIQGRSTKFWALYTRSPDGLLAKKNSFTSGHRG